MDYPFPHQVLSLTNSADNPSETPLTTVVALGRQNYCNKDRCGWGSRVRILGLKKNSKKSIKVSLIAVNNIIVVTYCSKCNRLSLSLIAVNETPLMGPRMPHGPHVRRTCGCAVNSPHIPHVRWKKLNFFFVPFHPSFPPVHGRGPPSHPGT
jgi:hypothetical protein